MQDEKVKIKGKVKWYSKRKKYGFIVDEKNKEFFFHSDRLPKGSKIPKAKDIVEFTPLFDKRGSKATDLKIILKGESEKFRCPSCHEEIIPKIKEKNRGRGLLIKIIKNSSICPNCNYEFDEFVENEQERINLLFSVLFVVSLILLVLYFIF